MELRRALAKKGFLVNWLLSFRSIILIVAFCAVGMARWLRVTIAFLC